MENFGLKGGKMNKLQIMRPKKDHPDNLVSYSTLQFHRTYLILGEISDKLVAGIENETGHFFPTIEKDRLEPING